MGECVALGNICLDVYFLSCLAAVLPPACRPACRRRLAPPSISRRPLLSPALLSHLLVRLPPNHSARQPTNQPTPRHANTHAKTAQIYHQTPLLIVNPKASVSTNKRPILSICIAGVFCAFLRGWCRVLGWVMVVVVSASSRVRRAVALSVGLASWDVRASASAMNFSRGSAAGAERTAVWWSRDDITCVRRPGLAGVFAEVIFFPFCAC